MKPFLLFAVIVLLILNAVLLWSHDRYQLRSAFKGAIYLRLDKRTGELCTLRYSTGARLFLVDGCMVPDDFSPGGVSRLQPLEEDDSVDEEE